MEEEDRVIVPRQGVLLRDDADAAVEIAAADDSTEDEEDAGFEFEFPLVGSRGSSPALADELFADGRIRPLYPVFGRGADRCLPPPAPAPEQMKTTATRGQLGRLFMEETRAWNNSLSLSSGSTSSSSSTSSADLDDGGLEGLPPESYCVWAPGSSAAAGGSSPRPRARKSASMGSSMARWRRISDLVVGRSHSDGGKGKLLFLPPPPPKPKPSPAGKKKAAAATEIGTVAAARRMAYYGAAKQQQQQGGVPRRTFLPYREELVGFFANVNGVSRSSHPHPY
ncbi:uncharacterized protein LOC100822431 [Brachypodium distachyon]|uniref:Uncharacterized protein n=1 Tax=Brachypodium distachyon TaxID=15368 RepID=I1HFY0_BRADI|nr:uncharacterized protein LOC100822431 [Brachypodium distachyon]KQK04641.1 hypothetical protein BRADI_2g14860v3 [Brachypodium distachyon]|eukprot:XP_003567811.1 uncharacterized protein LOC100822431 [Brachypodium distachyon]